MPHEGVGGGLAAVAAPAFGVEERYLVVATVAIDAAVADGG
ncbi:MAG: hypothetical protein RIC89_21105 [Pseudomonadales bacterium]